MDAFNFSGADRWERYALKRLAWAKRDDDSIPDERYGFMPDTFAVNMHHTSFEE
jgi:hypothetical protein